MLDLLSPSSADVDRTVKKDVYAKVFRTPDYFCFDPVTLEGWRLERNNGESVYKPLKANEKGWLWSESLQAWLGTWDGQYVGMTSTWLRFFDKNGKLSPNRVELAQAEHQAAETKRQAAEAELARMREKLAELEKK